MQVNNKMNKSKNVEQVKITSVTERDIINILLAVRFPKFNNAVAG